MAGMGDLIGFSADAVTVSNLRKVGQGSNGARRLRGRWDGSKARAAMKCFLPGLHEMVMGVLGVARTLPRLVMQRPKVASGFKGRDSPLIDGCRESEVSCD
ncbi:hypothetical protein RA25_13725 [Leisingera sp. ANG-S5]|nr:hypothetical protein RA25_13725 [Leisingera sp. ANG-S5]